MIINTGTSNATGTKWSNDEMMMLYHLKKAKKTHNEIAMLMSEEIGKRDYTENSIKKKWNDTDWVAFLNQIGEAEAMVEEMQDRENEKQKIIETTLATQERFIRREQGRTDLIIDAVKSAMYRLPKPKPSSLTYSPRNRDKYTAEHVGIILSDLHIGASYTKEDTGGLSEFSLEIFKERMERMKHSVLEICERHRHVYDLPELHIFCLGDIVAGMPDAGAWSQNYIDQDIYDQMIEGVAALRDAICVWSRAFDKVNFYGIYGNHGRIGKRGANKDSTNWDRICYAWCKDTMREYDNVTWNIPTAWWIQTKIQDHNFYLTHGDGIRGSMGIPFYGVERAERNILGLMDEKPDYMLLGHFHSPAEIQTNSGCIIMNGSFMGGDMYSLKTLRRKDRAEQKMFGIHNKKGVTWTYNIQLEQEHTYEKDK